MHRLKVLLSAVACWAMLQGCSGSSDLGTVSGKVLYEGKPVPDATVVFHPKEGRMSSGKTDAEGAYTLMYTKDLPGAEIGTHTVKITTARLKITDKGEIPIREKLPAKYNVRSELKREVKAGYNTIDFDLEK